MKKILLVCAGGMSTGFLVQQLNKKAKEKNLDWTFFARSSMSFSKYLQGIDLICVAPQIRFKFDQIKILAKAKRKDKIYQIKNHEYSFLNADDLLASIKKNI